MTSSTLRLDTVGIAGVVVGAVGLLLPTLTLKANRVDGGESYLIWEIVPVSPLLMIGIVACLAIMTLLCLKDSGSVGQTGKLVAGSAILILITTILIFARNLVVPLGPAARISPSAGFWLLAICAYICISTVKTIRPSRMLVLSLSFVGALAIVIALGGLSHLAIMREFVNNRSRFFQDLINHIFLSLTAVLLAIIAGIPLGIMAWRRKLLERGIFALVNGIQTIPSLALLGLIIAPLSLLSFRFPFLRSLGIKGVGNAPALIALTLYALLPIVQNTYTSLANIRRPVIDAGWGMGMNRHQMLTLIEIPLSLPILMSGIRTSLVQTIGNTTVAALIGAAGLGSFIFRGLGQAAPDLIYLGVLPVILMAIVVDRLFGAVIRRISLPLAAGALQ